MKRKQPRFEISNLCINCQKRHIHNKKEFKVECQGIPKQLWEEGIYPIRGVLGSDIYDALSDEDKIELQYKYNILQWAKDKLNWSIYNPKRGWEQFYQKEFLLCNAYRKTARFGRRMGKTESIIIEALHYADTNDGIEVAILTPWQNTIEEIFGRIFKMLDSEDSVFQGNYHRKQKPYKVTLPNGSVIKGYTTGTATGSEGASTRGITADRLYYDESAYFSKKDLETTYALVMESAFVKIISTSTPSALDNDFKRWCLTDPLWKDFHYPSTLLPDYETKKEEFNKQYDEDSYQREVLANFYENSTKVFKTEDIEYARIKYNYYNSLNELGDPGSWITVMGVDWNEWKNGVQIIVLGYSLHTKKFRILNRSSINAKFKTQTLALQRIKQLDEVFHCTHIYVDEGHGSTQIEHLSAYYLGRKEHKKLKSVDFGSNYTSKEINPITGEYTVKRMKGVLVYHLQKRFEYKEIEISSLEETKNIELDFQLSDYHIEKYDNKDNPVFKGKHDHTLDALMLANFAFVENYQNIFNIVNRSKRFMDQKDLIRKPEKDSTIRPIYYNVSREQVVDLFNQEKETELEEQKYWENKAANASKKKRKSIISPFNSKIRRTKLF